MGAKIEVMQEVAEAQIKAGSKEAAKDYLQTLLEPILQGNHGSDWYNLKEIAALMARAGDPVAAVQIAQNIRSSGSRVDGLTAVAMVQAGNGARDDARKTIELALTAVNGIANEQLWSNLRFTFRRFNNRVSSPFQRSAAFPVLKNSALKAIAIALAQSGDLPCALETAKSIPTAEEFGGRSESVAAFSAIALQQAKNGDVAGALKTIDTIEDVNAFFADEKLAALKQIAREQTKAGDSRGVVDWAGNARAEGPARAASDAGRKHR